MTRAGRNLSKLTKGMDWQIAAPMWRRLSAAYARGAKGTIHVIYHSVF